MLANSHTLIYYLIALSVPLDKFLLYFSETEMKIGSIVICPMMSRKEYGVIMERVNFEYLNLNNLKPEKIKSIIENTGYLCDKDFLKFITQLSAYNMQKIGEVVMSITPNYRILHEGKNIKSKIIKNKANIVKNVQSIIELSQKQIEISEAIFSEITHFKSHVIDGVTGSGKTMIYLSVVEKIINLSDDSQILILLPEIALTPQTKEFFKSKLGFEPHIWHSGITKSQKKQTLQSMLNKTIRVIIGTRSAILLPFQNLKLIVIDEEHDQSYKQSDKMIYSGRDMAILRAKILDIPIILLSATLSLETYFNCKQEKYSMYKIEERYSKVEMPQVEIIDLIAKDAKPRSGESISPKVLQIAKDTIESGHQVLFFLNRRGFSSSIICGACQAFIECNNCSVNMAYHSFKNIMMCHYCGFSSTIPNECNTCKESEKWIKIGFGVERVSEELKKHFPNIKQQIFSSDEIGKINIDEVLSNITSGETQIIIGTQMISKGYNFPKLKCVVIVDTDTGFLDGDFRLYEKTYQMITQVSGRAGRFDERGLVLIQTYQKNNPAIIAIAKMDKEKFYADELVRRDSKYNPLPPLFRQIAIIISSANEDLAMNVSNNIMKYLYDEISHLVKIFGPAQSLIKRINRQYRYRILLSFSKKQGIMNEIREALSKFETKGNIVIKIDVDPMNFL